MVSTGSGRGAMLVATSTGSGVMSAINRLRPPWPVRVRYIKQTAHHGNEVWGMSRHAPINTYRW